MAEVSLKRTPQDFINYYSGEFQKRFDNYNLNFNKLGYLGYTLNILGEIQYDVKKYYDYLFKEGFVATSDEDFNLYMHAFIYGFNPNLATPSKAYGTVSLDFSFLNLMPSGVTKREIVLNNISFNVGDNSEIPFTTSDTIRFVQERNNYYGILENISSAKRKYIPSTDNVVTIDLEDFYQFREEETIYQVQDYKFGTFYAEPVTLNSGNYLCELIGSVRRNDKEYNESNDLDWDKYDIKIDKYLAQSNEDSLFLKINGPSNYIVECGSGIRGTWIPYARIKLNKKITYGSVGNLNSTYNILFAPTTNITVRDYDEFNNIKEVYLPSVQQLIQINFQYSEEGANPPTNEELRLAILRWIQSRENLINYRDYYNLANSKYTKDFKFVFKKSSMLDNIFYLHRLFRDKYFNPIKSFNKSTKNLEIYDDLNNVYNNPVIENIVTTKIFNEDYKLTNGTYQYIILAHNYFSSSVTDERAYITVNITDDTIENGIQLSWDPLPNVESYRVYKILTKIDLDTNEESIYYRYWDSYNTWFLDTGDIDDTGIYSDRLINYNLVIKPTFSYNNYEYISPFVYRYNSNMNWYDSYILYDNKIEYLTSSNNYYINADLPIFYFNIKYDSAEQKTYIDIKSAQDITNNYNIVIDIQALNIFNEELKQYDDHTYRYEYIDSTTNSLIFDQFSIKLYIYQDNKLLLEGNSNVINQVYDITDNLKLIKYTNILKDNIIVNIPVMDINVYNIDQEYYLEKVRTFLLTNDIENNRLVNDEVQFRFMNSSYIENIYLKSMLEWKHYNFNLEFPLKMHIKIYVDDLYISNNNINLDEERDKIYEFISKLLQNNYSGEYIRYYHSHIIDALHNDRPYIKTLSVDVTDSSNHPLNKGIDMLMDDDQILLNIQNINEETIDKKSLLMQYNPPYWHWDLDNIDIRFISGRNAQIEVGDDENMFNHLEHIETNQDNLVVSPNFYYEISFPTGEDTINVSLPTNATHNDIIIIHDIQYACTETKNIIIHGKMKTKNDYITILEMNAAGAKVVLTYNKFVNGWNVNWINYPLENVQSINNV